MHSPKHSSFLCVLCVSVAIKNDHNMNQHNTKFGANIYHRFTHLAWRHQISIGWQIARLQAQILFSNKFLLFIALVFGYSIICYVINYKSQMISRLTQEDILPVLLEIPLTVLVILVNMQVISSEKDNRTLEVMFTTAGSRYKIWALRLVTLNLLFFVLSLLLSTLAFFAFADMAILSTAIHGFIPVFFVGSVTLYFAVKFRSGFAAGMISGGVLLFYLMFTDFFEDTRYSLFFNPFDMPRQLDPETWNLWMWQNRITVFLLGCFMLFLALRGLDNRERMLR